MKAMILFLMSIAYTFSAMAGGEVQNGGGGWVNEGQYMTFFSAKIPAEKRALSRKEIPGMEYLIQQIDGLEISIRNKSELLEAIYPIRERAYYSVNSKKFTNSLKKDLIEKYADLMGVSKKNVALFAITDGKSGETFLLPDFYKLTKIEQAAILFHESLWILRNELNYDQVISMEQDAQAYFESNNSPENFYRFYSQLSFLLDDVTVGFLATLRFDQKQKIFFPFFNTQGLDIEKFFGEEFIKCLLSASWPESKDDNLKKCQKNTLTHLIFLETDYPDSIFVKFLIYYFSSEWSRVSFSFAANKGSSDLGNYSMSTTPIEEVFGLKFPIFNEQKDLVGYLLFSNF